MCSISSVRLMLKPHSGMENSESFFLAGPSPSESHRTRAAFNVSEVGGHGWSAAQGPSDSAAMNFTISSPANAVIGRYNLSLLVTSGNKIFSRYLGQFVLLFNPWCPGRWQCLCSWTQLTLLLSCLHRAAPSSCLSLGCHRLQSQLCAQRSGFTIWKSCCHHPTPFVP